MREPSRPGSPPAAAGPVEDARAREAESILRRVRQETDPQIGSGRMVTHAREHFAAKDADQSDPIEVLGTRIGRLLALFVFLALAVSLVFHFMRG